MSRYAWCSPVFPFRDIGPALSNPSGVPQAAYDSSLMTSLVQNSLHAHSSRDATFTGSPITVKFLRDSLPISPMITSPTCIPIQMSPFANIPFRSAGNFVSTSRADSHAATAFFSGDPKSKTTITASPINLSIHPPCTRTDVSQMEKYRFKNATTSSAASFSDMDVNERISEKSIATDRFSEKQPSCGFRSMIRLRTDGSTYVPSMADIRSWR